eukprot:TRINITY_DN227_c0_g2_i2.p1 TRINITY_DN227_c0_g2~~TRINITY_DN227_c0_g2_i2.p1  ORF type:complete len:127 (-),score=43.49 TRINITY_DN227_c0_g2_i2:511-891(-)
MPEASHARHESFMDVDPISGIPFNLVTKTGLYEKIENLGIWHEDLADHAWYIPMAWLETYGSANDDQIAVIYPLYESVRFINTTYPALAIVASFACFFGAYRKRKQLKSGVGSAYLKSPTKMVAAV